MTGDMDRLVHWVNDNMDVVERMGNLQLRAEQAEAELAECRKVLQEVIRCIDGAAEGVGCEHGSSMQEVCRVLQRTIQVQDARRLLEKPDA